MNKRARVLAMALAASSLLVAVPSAHAELRVGKNTRLTSDTQGFRGKDAIALAVNPTNPNHVVAVNNEYLEPSCEGTASFDGGSTWSTGDPLAVPAVPVGQQPFAPACSVIGDHLAESMKQTVAFGSGQNVYAAYATRRVNLAAPGGTEAQGIMVAKSTDGGRSWDTAAVAIPGGALDLPYYDLPTIGVQRGGGANGADRVYVAARETTVGGLSNRGDVAVVVSSNGGASFSDPPAVLEGPTEDATDVSQPAVAPDGTVYVAWRMVGPSGTIKIARSDNQGQSWGTPVEVATVTNLASNANTNPPAPAASSGSTFPRIAVGPNGNVYMVYNQGRARPGAPAGGFQGADHFIPPDSDVYFQRSVTKGAAWSTPKLINEATPKPGNESPYNPPSGGVVTQTRHPNVAVAPNGRVDIVWQDRRHWYRGCVHTHQRCNEARLGDTYYSSSGNAGTTFSANHRISDRSHNNDVGYDYRFGVGWAFGPVVVPQGNDRLLVGWMDARNGGFDNDTQDIFLAKVNVNGPASVAQENLVPSDPASTSVLLSRHTYPGGGEGLLNSTFASRSGTKVVIANQNDAPAILAAGVLARANLSQVLLSPPGGLPAGVKAEVARMKPAGAFVVGDAASLSDQVVTDLAAAGVPNDANQIVRLGGSSPSSLGQQIAETLDRRTDAEKTADTPAFNAVAVVNPSSPDASAVAGLAAARRLPILFTTTDSIPQATKDAIANLDIDRTLVIGGPQWVSNTVLDDLPAPKRLGGKDQYATSRAVVNESIDRGLPKNLAYVADGAKPIEGALLGSTVGRVTALMLLSKASVSSTAAGVAGGLGLSDDLDRLIILGPAAAQAPRPPLGTSPVAPTATFPGCPVLTANVIRGTAASNTITGTTGADRIFAGTGDDVVDALAGNDCVDLGTGNDRGQGGLGADFLLAGTGTDRVSGSSGNDRMRGNAGNDRLNGGSGNDRVFGDAGNDTLLGSFGNDVLHGVSGKDVISGSRGRDRINGGSGNDRISGGSSADRISGDAGNDRINGNSGADRIRGNSGNDRITSRDNSRDRVNCGRGRDTVLADRRDIVASNCERVIRRR